MNSILVTEANHGEHLLVGADVLTLKASSDQTAGSMLIFETLVLPGGGPPMLHRHAYSEVFYFLKGEFEISTVDAEMRLQTQRVKTGDSVAIPSMAWHNFKNVGATHGKFLAIHSPPVMEVVMREIGVPVEDLYNPPMPAGPPSTAERERFMSLIGKYMELLLPDQIKQ